MGPISSKEQPPESISSDHDQPTNGTEHEEKKAECDRLEAEKKAEDERRAAEMDASERKATAAAELNNSKEERPRVDRTNEVAKKAEEVLIDSQYSLDQVRKGEVHDMDWSKRESYLSPNDFNDVFGMTFVAFK